MISDIMYNPIVKNCEISGPSMDFLSESDLDI